MYTVSDTFLNTNVDDNHVSREVLGLYHVIKKLERRKSVTDNQRIRSLCKDSRIVLVVVCLVDDESV